jgi:hypothetical protein
MAIFISHSTKDNESAQKVFYRLQYTHDIACYIDDMDKELEKNRGKSSLTPLLVDRLRKCDTLLAIVTENTKESWWVPFEIGAAREMPKIITSYTSLPEPSSFIWKEALPEYLLEWPRLRSDNDIDTFAREYKKKQSLLIEKTHGYGNFSQRLSPEIDVRNFEELVMKSLGQRSY